MDVIREEASTNEELVEPLERPEPTNSGRRGTTEHTCKTNETNEGDVDDERTFPTDMGEAFQEKITMDELELFRKGVAEDERLESIFRSKQILMGKFDNRAYLHPHGMTDFDHKAINEDRRDKLEKFKHKTRHENYRYLGQHYELDAMLNLFFKKLLNAKPQDTVHFAAEYFTQDTLQKGYEDMLEIEKRKVSNYRVAKMKAAQKITTTLIHEVKKPEKKEVLHYHRCPKKGKPPVVHHCEDDQQAGKLIEDSGINKAHDANLNWLKKLNIGPLALDFDTRLIQTPEIEEIKKAPIRKKKHKYCGCKDPGRKHLSHPKTSQKISESEPIEKNEGTEEEKGNDKNLEGTNDKSFEIGA